MFNISSFLSKFSRNINAIELQKEMMVEIIEQKTQIRLKIEEIEIKNFIIYINASPGVKNKIFIFKEGILAGINKNIPIKIVDIR